MYMHVKFATCHCIFMQVSTRQDVYIHPSSCLFHARPQPRYVVYSELVHTSKCYMRWVRYKCMVVYKKIILSLVRYMIL
jgi:hypothetical protein